jgi:hypothetical protein
MSEWRSIETAPKDGARVLLAIAGQWVGVASLTDWGWQMDHTAEYDNEYATVTGATHWQPLPEPPTPSPAMKL